jgi:hypothetical protein
MISELPDHELLPQDLAYFVIGPPDPKIKNLPALVRYNVSSIEVKSVLGTLFDQKPSRNAVSVLYTAPSMIFFMCLPP